MQFYDPPIEEETNQVFNEGLRGWHIPFHAFRGMFEGRASGSSSDDAVAGFDNKRTGYCRGRERR
jgi:hypothetical protein